MAHQNTWDPRFDASVWSSPSGTTAAYDPYFDPYSNADGSQQDDSQRYDQGNLYDLEPWWESPQASSSGYHSESSPGTTPDGGYNAYSLPSQQRRRALRFRDVMTPSFEYLEFSPPRRRAMTSSARQSLPSSVYMEFSPPPRRRLKRRTLQYSPTRRQQSPVYMEISPPGRGSASQLMSSRQQQMQRLQQMQQQRMQRLRQRRRLQLQEEQRQERRSQEVAEADLLGLDTPDDVSFAYQQQYRPQRLLFDDFDTQDLISFDQ